MCLCRCLNCPLGDIHISKRAHKLLFPSLLLISLHIYLFLSLSILLLLSLTLLSSLDHLHRALLRTRDPLRIASHRIVSHCLAAAIATSTPNHERSPLKQLLRITLPPSHPYIPLIAEKIRAPATPPSTPPTAARLEPPLGCHTEAVQYRPRHIRTRCPCSSESTLVRHLHSPHISIMSPPCTDPMRVRFAVLDSPNDHQRRHHGPQRSRRVRHDRYVSMRARASLSSLHAA